jgi:predicted O-methyltransferase YrrM
MAKTGKFDDLGPVYMVDEHYETFKEITKNYNKNHILLEIGSLNGRSAIEMLSNNKNINLYCLDKWTKHPIHIFQNNIKRYNLGDRVFTIKDKSSKVRSYFKDFTVDFIYLDACHKYEFVLNDLKLCHHILNQMV